MLFSIKIDTLSQYKKFIKGNILYSLSFIRRKKYRGFFSCYKYLKKILVNTTFKRGIV